MKTLCPAPIRPGPRTQRAIEFAEDAARLVAIAAAGGYTLTSGDAKAIWKSYSESVCASWLVLPADDAAVLRKLLEHGVVSEDPSPRPAPPESYGSWLDYAVATMDVRSLELSTLFSDAPSPYTRESFREAARAELAALRRAAGLS